MEKQQTGKRSVGLPITLILLVFSLIGNVFLYSHYLQDKQDKKYETGKKIFAAVAESKAYFEQLIPHLDALLASSSGEQRLEEKFLTGGTAQKGQAFAELSLMAKEISGQSNEGAAEAKAYVDEVEAALKTIGNYDGPLNDGDKSYLLELKKSLESFSGIMNGFNSNIGDNRVALIRLSSGLDWTQLVEKVQQEMSTQSVQK